MHRRAQVLRKTMTNAESVLWDLLRSRRLQGRKFRRQHPIGSYIADFYCHKEKLVIELDGAHHKDNIRVMAYDNYRTSYFEKRGLRIIRFENDIVLNQTSYVLNEISKAFR